MERRDSAASLVAATSQLSISKPIRSISSVEGKVPRVVPPKSCPKEVVVGVKR